MMNFKFAKYRITVSNCDHRGYTVVNGKIFDNISPNGIDFEDFRKRLIPEVGRSFEIIEIFD